MKRDGSLTSIWQTVTSDYNSTPTPGEAVFDVIVVGAGITGVTTALLLQQAGKKCLLVDAANAGFGTTGGTTAHLNTLYDTPYYQMIKDFGEEEAKLIALGAHTAINTIKNNISSHNIDCDFIERDGYLFSLDEKQDEELGKMIDSAHKVGVSIERVDVNPFPIPYLGVARVPGQAQFHPTKYIIGLIKAFTDGGGIMVENCRVDRLDQGEMLKVHTSKGEVSAKAAVYATHVPPGVNLLHFRCAPYRSYVVAARLKDDEYPPALGYDLNDPYHYYRNQLINGQNYLIVGGEDHKTGHEENTEASFLKLEAHVRTYFRVEEFSFRWSSQFYEPVDGLPYIGHLPGNGDNVYVATGFGGNGMIYGTLAGLIISNLIVNGESIYKSLLNPNRVKPMAGFADFVKEGVDVVKQFVSGSFSAEKLKEFSEMAVEEGKIVKYEKHVIGVYKDGNGSIHAVNSICPHVKCTVAWNASEKSWDCPCHGSRFSYDGTMLTAPAVKDLDKIDLTKES